ncbi:hypothetical protein FGX01_03065, partial [Xylella fastidiosa subsp. multiplex]|nr:hypothetical protein [Xylella fastidiosa subsp. multiplex]
LEGVGFQVAVVQRLVGAGGAGDDHGLDGQAVLLGDLRHHFQHIPFLNDQIKQRSYKLVPVANTLISPIAFYSKKYKSLKDLPDG